MKTIVIVVSVVGVLIVCLVSLTHGQLFNLFGLTVTANKLPSFGGNMHHSCSHHHDHGHKKKGMMYSRHHHRRHPDDDLFAYLMEDDIKKKKRHKDYKKKVITIQKSHKNDQFVDVGDLFKAGHGGLYGSASDYHVDDYEGSPSRFSNDMKYWLGEDFFYIR